MKKSTLMWRMAPLGLVLLFCAPSAKADLFQISFTGGTTGTGSFTTDGICNPVCTKANGGLTSFSASITGLDFGANAFDLIDDTNNLIFVRGLGLANVITNSETQDILNFQPAGAFQAGGVTIFTQFPPTNSILGTYTITASSVPEPSSFLLVGIALLVGAVLTTRSATFA